MALKIGDEGGGICILGAVLWGTVPLHVSKAAHQASTHAACMRQHEWCGLRLGSFLCP